MDIGRIFSYLRGRVLEVGAGIGTFSNYLLRAPITSLICIEPSPNLFIELRRRVREATCIQLALEEFADKIDDKFNCIVLVNVLEHMRNDAEAISIVSELLVKGGYICVFVPALSFLYGPLDRQFQHYRRYNKKMLYRLLSNFNFHIIKLNYFNSAGVITWFVINKLFRGKVWHKSTITLYDKLVVKLLSKLERVKSPIIGQSLIAIAQKI